MLQFLPLRGSPCRLMLSSLAKLAERGLGSRPARIQILRLKNPDLDILRAGVFSFEGVSTNNANDDNRADSRSRNSAVDSHSRNKVVDSRSSLADSNRRFQRVCGSS